MKQTNHNFMSAALKLQTIFPSLNKATIYQGCKLEPSRGFKGGNIIWNVLSRIATGVKDNPRTTTKWGLSSFFSGLVSSPSLIPESKTGNSWNCGHTGLVCVRFWETKISFLPDFCC